MKTTSYAIEEMGDGTYTVVRLDRIPVRGAKWWQRNKTKTTRHVVSPNCETHAQATDEMRIDIRNRQPSRVLNRTMYDDKGDMDGCHYLI